MYCVQCVALDSEILIAGAYGNESSYILEKEKWKTFIDMPFCPYDHAVVLSDNLIFAFYEDEIYSLKVGENKWQKLNIKSKGYYGGHRIVEENGFVFITYLKRWDVFDAVKKEWIFTGDSILPFSMVFTDFYFLKAFRSLQFVAF